MSSGQKNASFFWNRRSKIHHVDMALVTQILTSGKRWIQCTNSSKFLGKHFESLISEHSALLFGDKLSGVLF